MFWLWYFYFLSALQVLLVTSRRGEIDHSIQTLVGLKFFVTTFKACLLNLKQKYIEKVAHIMNVFKTNLSHSFIVSLHELSMI